MAWAETVLTAQELADALCAVGRGDRDAFRRLYSATSAKLFGVCLRILREREPAEDALQETYLNVWRRAATYDPTRATAMTWLATLARNQAIDRLRRTRNGSQPSPVEVFFDMPDETPPVEEGLILRHEIARLSDCLEQLDARTRGSIHAAFWSGVTYRTLAEREAVPLGTMKSWMRRGLLKLRACLEP